MRGGTDPGGPDRVAVRAELVGDAGSARGELPKEVVAGNKFCDASTSRTVYFLVKIERL